MRDFFHKTTRDNGEPVEVVITVQRDEFLLGEGWLIADENDPAAPKITDFTDAEAERFCEEFAPAWETIRHEDAIE